MKMIKKIIIRVIVAVTLTFILSKMRLLSITNVYARDVLNKQPTSVTFFNSNYESTSNNLAPLNFMINRSTFYGQQLNLSSSGVSAISFNFDLVENDFTSNYNTTMQFVFYSNGINFNDVPFRFYIRDFANHHSSCYVEGTRKYPSNNYQFSDSLLMEQVSTVYCPNVFVNAPGFQIYATGNYSSSSGSNILVGISNVTVTNNNESEKSIQDIKDNTKETNDLIKNDNVDSASNKAEEFFDDFDSNDYGLKDVVLAPVSFIESLLDYQCQPLRFPLPFVNEDVVLPCMSTVYSQYPTFYTLWQMITTGMICYYVCLNIFGKIKQLTDPLNDRIEVIQL